MTKPKSRAVSPKVRHSTSTLLPSGRVLALRRGAEAQIRQESTENDTERGSEENAAWFASLSRQEQEIYWANRYGRPARKFGLKMEEGSNGGECGHYLAPAQLPLDHFSHAIEAPGARKRR